MGKITDYTTLEGHQLTGNEYLLLETGAGTRNTTVNALVDNIKNYLPETPTKEDYEELKKATTVEKDGEKIPLKEYTYQKIDQLKTYVTPEMYGAKGDGITDDTQAFESALASGLKVVGNKTKTYFVKNLSVERGWISDCNFADKNTHADTCLVVSSYSKVTGCKIHAYNNGIEKILNNPSVHVIISDNVIDYCVNGIYLDCNNANGSLNNVIIKDNYFARCGVNADSGDIEEDTGMAICVSGNIDGCFISNNVFEYNARCGIAVYNNNVNYIVGCAMNGNYFEGNRLAPIEVNIKNGSNKNQISVTQNFFSTITTNVKGTRYIKWVKGFTNGVVEDNNRVMVADTSIVDVDSHIIKLNSNAPQYFALIALKQMDVKFLRIRYTYTGGTGLKIIASTKAVTTDLVANGYNEFVIPYDYSFYTNRKLNAGEEVTMWVDTI